MTTLSRARWVWALSISLAISSMGMVYRHRHIIPSPDAVALATSGLTKASLAEAFGFAGAVQKFPNEMDLKIDGKPGHVIVQYAFDSGLQEYMEEQFKSYRPDYGAFVAIDAATGRVLSMVSYTHEGEIHENLTLRATFPSASVFKVVTAAAAISEKKFSGDTVVAYNGRNHTLFRGNIFKTSISRGSHHITLREAFAKSVNTVFGKIGVYTVGANDLKDYANRFGFNRQILADVPIQQGHAAITDDPWELAEAASGYTRENTMSPLQGALIAATMANDGLMMEPYIVQSVHSLDGTKLYSAEAKKAVQVVDSATAAEIRTLMNETVSHGTSRKSFRGFFKGRFSNLDVGGKTGSLTGMDPPGKYDWFVGFARNGEQRIAIAALTIHQKLWRVKSSYLARRAMENFFAKRHDVIVEVPAGAGPAVANASVPKQ